MYQKYIKRGLDFVIALILTVILSPVIIVLCLLIALKLGRPIFFKQNRVGKDEKIFRMIKFRTMTTEKDENGNLYPDEKRLTKFGRMLRSTSLDELPELFNILAGDLSIVGPRPLFSSYLPYYTEYEKRRHKVRGGLVPPEVLYNNIQPSWEEQFKYEVYYAENVSFMLDLKILLSLVKGILKRNSVDYGGYIRKSLIEERHFKEPVEIGK